MEALNLLTNLVNKRIASPARMQKNGALLDHIIQDMETQKVLTHEFVVLQMFKFSLASESAQKMALFLIKFLEENPLVLEELMVEHEGILQKRQNPNSSLTWEEYKSMTFTIQVINETLRLGFQTPGIPRKAKKDIQVNGMETML